LILSELLLKDIKEINFSNKKNTLNKNLKRYIKRKISNNFKLHSPKKLRLNIRNSKKNRKRKNKGNQRSKSRNRSRKKKKKKNKKKNKNKNKNKKKYKNKNKKYNEYLIK